MNESEKKERLKQIIHEFKQWCSECDRSTLGNDCSGYQSEKCLQRRKEWVQEELEKLDEELSMVAEK